MGRESHNARLAQAYLDQVCAWLDEGHNLPEISKALRKVVAVGPAAVLAAGLAASACSGKFVEAGGDGGAGGTGSGSENCTNGVDDDGDGLIDCGDDDCDANPACYGGGTGGAVYAAPWEDCSNGYDDDHDGLTDCADSDCYGDVACGSGGVAGAYMAPWEDCSNGYDDDYDGLKDCADPDCYGTPDCGSGGTGGAYMAPWEDCANGYDDDYDGLTDCADSDCAGDPACPFSENCLNGVDDDGDGLVDEQDPDCQPCGMTLADPACDACLKGECLVECTVCTANASCNEFVDCLMPCTDAACWEACISLHPEGAAIFDAIDSCMNAMCVNACQ